MRVKHGKSFNIYLENAKNSYCLFSANEFAYYFVAIETEVNDGIAENDSNSLAMIVKKVNNCLENRI